MAGWRRQGDESHKITFMAERERERERERESFLGSFMLWFEYEMPPTGSCVEHLGPSLWHSFGRFWKFRRWA
jgi:hypothetical protein